MIVAPGTAASAAALTFAAVVPVSNVSPGPCDRVAGSAAGVPDDAADDAAVVGEAPVVAALAIPAPPIAAPTAAALTINNVRPRLAVGLDPGVASPGWPGAGWLVSSDCMIAPSGGGNASEVLRSDPTLRPRSWSDRTAG